MIRSSKLIDTSLSYGYKQIKNPPLKDITRYIYNLEKAGIDIVEIPINLLQYKEIFIDNMSYGLRMNLSSQWLTPAMLSKISYLVVSLEMYLTMKSNKNIAHGKKVILEVFLDSGDVFNQIRQIKHGIDLDEIDILRLKGLSGSVNGEIHKIIEYVKNEMNILIDICPTNKLYCATSVAVEAILAKASFITGAFTGMFGKFELAPLEEVIMSSVVLLEYLPLKDFSSFSETTALFSRIFNKKIPKDKPILGKNIFHCESGIHVNGIEKDSQTYEPYDPQIVGLKRIFVIGKHSGKTALSTKLKSLGFVNSDTVFPQLLEQIRKNSIVKKKDLSISDLEHLLEGV